MFTTILVPLDGSLFGERALPTAVGLARRAGARLVLAKMSWPTRGAGPDEVPPDFETPGDALRYLDGLAGPLRDEGLDVVTVARETPAAAGVLAEIELSGADLVVMSTHGRSGMQRLMYGSVAEAVLAQSPVPVWLVRATGSTETVLDEERPRLIVPLDGSPFGEAALPVAEALTRVLDGTVVLLHVAPPDTSEHHGLSIMSEQVRHDERGAARYAYLAEKAAAVRDAGLRVQSVVRVGNPADQILEEACIPTICLIVMGTHGRTGLRRMILGSVATDVLRRGCRSLLLVRPDSKAEVGEVDNELAVSE